MNHSDYTYRRIFSFLRQFLLRPYWPLFSLSTFLTATSSAVWLYNSYAFAKVVSFVTYYKTGESLQPLYMVFVIWFIVVIIRQLAVFLTGYIGVFAAERAAIDVEVFAVKHLSRLDISWHEKENTGNKMKRIDQGSRAVVNMNRIWLGTIVDVVVSFLGALIIISHFASWKIVTTMVVYLFIYYFIAVSSRNKGMQAMHFANIKDEEITGLWFEIVANIRSVKILGMASKIMEFSRAVTSEFLGRVQKRIFWFRASGLLQGTFQGIVQIAFIIYIILGIADGHYQVGFLVLFYGYFNALSGAVAQLSGVTEDIATAKSNIGRLTDILDAPIVIDNEKGKINFPEIWDAMHFRNVSFNYGDKAVLSNINLDIKKGEKIGIVGLSGAGKSTLFKLMLKEYENYEGEILIGDVPLKTIKKSSYVNHIAAVLQEIEVFNMTLHRNIVLVNNSESENKELFDRALVTAHVNDFLPKLPQGIETLIGEKGVKLSGGEKQRLGIARAVFKSPEILFLDEATSHLDIESEQKIQDSLKKFFKDVTAIVIAHRLSTIREMDRIIVIEGGKIIESGTFDELHAKSGRFREFWDKQRK